ncbi:DUF1800 domain-containing protein [Thalassotalea sp. PLHSN55]|uniref:DUF1800 domain-containing protein n=1 Tax=Thalassotalea sp. PLHSN55 TaxID=3435888 RepID=UPI003F876B54
MSSIQAVIAVNRFGLGARPLELAAADKNPKMWLISQLNQSPALSFTTALPTSVEISKKLAKLKQAERAEKKQANKDLTNAKEKSKKYNRELLRGFSVDTVNSAIASPNSLNWRLLDFFSNHFSVTAQGPYLTALAGTLEREAIAPNLLGSFEDMLLAVSSHPTMILYLNNERSFGPDSRLGKKGKGLNENLAREILELHTLGVNGGYDQDDVTELAMAITGWSVANPRKEEQPGFIFRKVGHQPGTRTLLTKRYSQKGVEQGRAMLQDLARHPATAQHICYKLARHFVSDQPPKALVKQLNQRWQKTNGNIKDVMIELVQSEHAWSNTSVKYKTPREFIISACRAVDAKKVSNSQLFNSLASLGQRPFNAGSPAGYGDVQEDWNGGNALIARIEWASMFASKYKANAEKTLAHIFSKHVSKRTYQSVLRAESRRQAMTLLLMSPEFLRR